jgi:hypothetical protein
MQPRRCAVKSGSRKSRGANPGGDDARERGVHSDPYFVEDPRKLRATPEEEQAILDCLNWLALDVKVVSCRKVRTETVRSRRDIWDVHTDLDRWWVITDPTVLYPQSQFRELDSALQFHADLYRKIEN